MRATDWNQLPLFLSVAETAKVVGYGEARIRELCHAANGIPNLRSGRKFRIPRKALRAWSMNEAALNSTGIIDKAAS